MQSSAFSTLFPLLYPPSKFSRFKFETRSSRFAPTNFRHSLPLLHRTRLVLNSSKHLLPSHHICMAQKSSGAATHSPCSHPRHLRKSSFHSSHWECHQSSEKPLFRHRPAGDKSQKRRILLPHRLKGHRKIPEQATAMIFIIILPLVCCYALCRAICNSWILLLF